MNTFEIRRTVRQNNGGQESETRAKFQVLKWAKRKGTTDYTDYADYTDLVIRVYKCMRIYL